MADENLPIEEKVRRSVGRSFRRGVLFVVLLAGLMGWGSNSTGFRACQRDAGGAAGARSVALTPSASGVRPCGSQRVADTS